MTARRKKTPPAPEAAAEMVANIPAELLRLAVSIGDLQHDPRNARLHTKAQLTQLCASLEAFGQDQPVVVQREGMIVRKGNARLEAARQLGWTHIAALVVDEPAAKAIARGIADNRISDLARMDEDILAEHLKALAAEEYPTGFTADETEALLRAGRDGGPTEDDPGAQTPTVERGTEIGDLWILGRHRLLCGDSTCPEHVAFVVGSNGARVAFTDPPYNVDYGATKDHPSWRIRSIAPARDGGRLRVGRLGPGRGCGCGSGCATPDCTGARTIVWAKDRHVLAPAKYQRATELCVYGWFGDKSSFCGGRRQTDLWHVPRPSASPDHPTMKPVELASRALLNSTVPGDVVLDLFTGGGSTLVAAEQRGRTFVGLEIDPGYVESSVRRWERLTGKRAEIVKGAGRRPVEVA